MILENFVYWNGHELHLFILVFFPENWTKDIIKSIKYRDIHNSRNKIQTC